MRHSGTRSLSRTALPACLLCAVTEVWMPAAADAQARTPGQDREAIVRLENIRLDAHDSTALDTILAPDFVHPVVTGDFLTKKQHIDWVTSHQPLSRTHSRFGSMDFRLYGDAAVVNGIVIASNGDGKEIRGTIFSDVFAFRHGRWQAINAQETRVGELTKP